MRGGSVRGCQGFCLVWGPSRNWGLHPEPRRRSRHSRGERDVLAGGAGQNMIPFSFPACGRGNSARRALPGESVGRKGGLGPSGLFTGCRPDLLGVPYRASPLDGRGLDTLQGISHPQSLPLGGRTVRGTVRSGPGEATINHRCPSAHTGADEGATLYPTFPCRSRKGGPECRPNGIFLLLRWATRSPPHQSPPVTASPQGEASGLCSPTRKSAPNQGTHMGTVIAPRLEQCDTQPQNERVPTSGP